MDGDGFPGIASINGHDFCNMIIGGTKTILNFNLLFQEDF
jgi:hypothetical protein